MEVNFDELKGKVIVSITGKEGDDIMVFKTDEGDEYIMYHAQDCCERVDIYDIIGDLTDLLNTTILLAEEVESDENPPDYVADCQDSFTWTFYKLATIKGYVTIRWYGESNGYYGEEVTFEKIIKES